MYFDLAALQRDVASSFYERKAISKFLDVQSSSSARPTKLCSTRFHHVCDGPAGPAASTNGQSSCLHTHQFEMGKRDSEASIPRIPKTGAMLHTGAIVTHKTPPQPQFSNNGPETLHLTTTINRGPSRQFGNDSNTGLPTQNAGATSCH